MYERRNTHAEREHVTAMGHELSDIDGVTFSPPGLNVHVSRSTGKGSGHGQIAATPVVQRYQVAQSGATTYRVADDLSAVARVGYPNHILYMLPGKAARSNTALKAVGSGIELSEQSSGVDVKQGATRKTLNKVIPQNKTNMTKGEKMKLWADCGKSSGVVVGSSTRVGQYNAPDSGNLTSTSATSPSSIRAEIMKKWLEHALTGSSLDAKQKKAIKKILKQAQALMTEIQQLGVDYGNAKTDAEKESIASNYFAKHDQRAEVLWGYYNGLSDADKTAIDKSLGINRYAQPEIGEGFTMGSGGPAYPNVRTWNFHWGGVIAESDDKKDKITLENYAVGDASVQNEDWDIAMYGTVKTGQTFHEQHRATKQHGKAPTTVRIKKQ